MAKITFDIPDGLDIDTSELEAKFQQAIQRAVREAERKAYQQAIGNAVNALKESLDAAGVDLSGHRLTIYFNGKAGPEWKLYNTTNGPRKGRKRIRLLKDVGDIKAGTVFESSNEMRAVLAEFEPALGSASAKKWPTKAFQRLGIRYEWVN